jgi:hypothetical protein
MTRSHASPQAGSLRLDFAYDASGLRLHKRTPRGKPARPGAALDRDPPPNAVVVELRSPNGTVQYRQLLADPIPQTAEISDDDGSYHRIADAEPSGGFSVVVPRFAAPSEVVVSAGPEVELAQPGLAPPAGHSRRWRELLRLRLVGGGDGGQ